MPVEAALRADTFSAAPPAIACFLVEVHARAAAAMAACRGEVRNGPFRTSQPSAPHIPLNMYDICAILLHNTNEVWAMADEKPPGVSRAEADVANSGPAPWVNRFMIMLGPMVKIVFMEQGSIHPV